MREQVSETPFHCSPFHFFNISLSCISARLTILLFLTVHTHQATAVLIKVIAKNRPGPVQRKREKNTNEREMVKPIESWKGCQSVCVCVRCVGLKVHNCADQVFLLFRILFSPMRMDLLLSQSKSERQRGAGGSVGRGGCLYGKRL